MQTVAPVLSFTTAIPPETEGAPVASFGFQETFEEAVKGEGVAGKALEPDVPAVVESVLEPHFLDGGGVADASLGWIMIQTAESAGELVGGAPDVVSSEAESSPAKPERVDLEPPPVIPVSGPVARMRAEVGHPTGETADVGTPVFGSAVDVAATERGVPAGLRDPGGGPLQPEVKASKGGLPVEASSKGIGSPGLLHAEKIGFDDLGRAERQSAFQDVKPDESPSVTSSRTNRGEVTITDLRHLEPTAPGWKLDAVADVSAQSPKVTLGAVASVVLARASGHLSEAGPRAADPEISQVFATDERTGALDVRSLAPLASGTEGMAAITWHVGNAPDSELNIVTYQSLPANGPLGATTPSNIMAQLPGLVAHMNHASNDGSCVVTEIALAPEELGRVLVRLQAHETDSDRIVVMMTFDRPEAMDLFRRHSEQLLSDLRAAGYSAASFEFTQSDANSERGSQKTADPPQVAWSDTPVISTDGSPLPLSSTTSLDLRL